MSVGPEASARRNRLRSLQAGLQQRHQVGLELVEACEASPCRFRISRTVHGERRREQGQLVVGLEAQRLPVRGDGLAPLLLETKVVAEPVPRDADVGIEREGGPIGGGLLVAEAEVPASEPEQVVRSSHPWMLLDHVLQQLVGLLRAIRREEDLGQHQGRVRVRRAHQAGLAQRRLGRLEVSQHQFRPCDVHPRLGAPDLAAEALVYPKHRRVIGHRSDAPLRAVGVTDQVQGAVSSHPGGKRDLRHGRTSSRGRASAGRRG